MHFVSNCNKFRHVFIIFSTYHPNTILMSEATLHFWSRAATTGSDTSQPTPHYAWLWTLAQAVNRTSGRSGSASEEDPAEHGCSRSRTTLGSTPTMPGGSYMTASLGGRYDPWPVKRSTDWLTDFHCFACNNYSRVHRFLNFSAVSVALT